MQSEWMGASREGVDYNSFPLDTLVLVGFGADADDVAFISLIRLSTSKAERVKLNTVSLIRIHSSGK